jgi:hypothetical protein
MGKGKTGAKMPDRDPNRNAHERVRADHGDRGPALNHPGKLHCTTADAAINHPANSPRSEGALTACSPRHRGYVP